MERIPITEICELIGEEQTQKLIDTFPGMYCRFPKKRNILQFPTTEAKMDYIERMFKGGLGTFEEIAAKMDLGVEQVKKLYYERLRSSTHIK
jgi:hypothetical protein